MAPINRSGPKFTIDESHPELMAVKKRCENTLDQFTTVVLNTTNFNVDSPCPRTFDGILCWDETPAGQTVVQSCPNYINRFNPSNKIKKACVNGTWEDELVNDESWKNYATCIWDQWFTVKDIIANAYIVGLSISVFCLIISVIVFRHVRSRSSNRVVIQKNSFIALCVYDLLWIIWYVAVINKDAVIQANAMPCKSLQVLTQMMKILSYSWFFCQILNLFMSVFIVYFQERDYLKYMIYGAWTGSVLSTVCYTVSRYIYTDDDNRCWLGFSHANWIIDGPIIFSLFAFVGLALFSMKIVSENIKLRSQTRQEHWLKVCRSSLLLLPQFGLQHFMLPFFPEPETPGEYTKQLMLAIFVSLQGTILSIALCYVHPETWEVIRKWLTPREQRYLVTQNKTNLTVTREIQSQSERRRAAGAAVAEHAF